MAGTKKDEAGIRNASCSPFQKFLRSFLADILQCVAVCVVSQHGFSHACRDMHRDMLFPLQLPLPFPCWDMWCGWGSAGAWFLLLFSVPINLITEGARGSVLCQWSGVHGHHSGTLWGLPTKLSIEELWPERFPSENTGLERPQEVASDIPCQIMPPHVPGGHQ